MNHSQHIKSLISILLLGFCTLTVQAQHTSVQGRFSVDYTHGCTGWQVNVTINDPAGEFESPTFWYTGFDDNEPANPSTSHIYNTSGTYYIAMLINNTDPPYEGNQLDSILVEVHEPHEPTFVIHNCDGHKVRVEITDDYYDSYTVNFTTTDSESVAPNSLSNEYDYGTQGDYRIDVQGQFTDGAPNCTVINRGFTSIDQIINPVITSLETLQNGRTDGSLQMAHTLGDNSFYYLFQSIDGSDAFDSLSNASGAETLINSINTTSSYSCYQINTYDACNDLILQSNILCSVDFNVESSDGGNLLLWDTDETQATHYNLIRNNSLLTEINDTSIKNFTDTAVICKQEYAYNVQAVFDQGSSTALDTAIFASQSGELPPITTNPSSTISTDNEVVLNWTAPNPGEIPFRRYIVEKNINNRHWRYVDATEDTTYTDAEADFIGLHSYRISYDDDCGNTATPSPFTNPIILTQTSARGKVVTYQWNKYEIWEQGIRNYTLERIDTAGRVLEEFPVLSGRTKEIEFGINDLDDKFIRVRAESLDDETLYSYSNVIETQLKTQMFLPKAFTPDGDNLNDRFIAEGPAVFNFRMEIYNRWGNRIYETSDLVNGWDGMINGEKAREGTYVYKIYYEDGEGKRYDQTGSLLLLRHG